MAGKTIFIRLLALFGLAVLAGGCLLNPNRTPTWNADLLTPVAKSSLDIYDVLQDSSLVTVGQGNLISVVYSDTLYTLDPTELVALPDTGFNFTVTLDTLSLNTDTITEIITLGQLALQLKAEGNPAGDILLANNNQTLPFTPPIDGLSSGVIEVDISQYFQYAELTGGWLDLEIFNGFPLALDSVVLELRNGPPPALVSDEINTIPPGATEKRSYDLSGETLTSLIEGELININVAQGFNVPIDTSDFIRISLVGRDLRARTATAVFPTQTILEQTERLIYQFGDPGPEEIRVRNLRVRSGRLEAFSETTISDTMVFNYAIANALNDVGQSPAIELKIEPAPPNGVGTQTDTRDLEGFLIDMSLNGSTSNVINQQIKADLVFSGNLTTLEQTDSLRVSFTLKDIDPSYIDGYFGQPNFDSEGIERVTFFDELNVERLRLTQPKAAIRLQNSIGMAANVTIVQLRGTNSATGASLTLAGTPTLAGPLKVDRPGLGQVGQEIETRVEFNSENSNLPAFINLQPDEVSYKFLINGNPEGNPQNPDNFATDSSRLHAILDLEVPLAGVVDNMVLADTSEVDFAGTDIDEIEKITLRLLLDNRFPMEGRVTGHLLDENGELLFTLSQEGVMAPGIPDANGYVDAPVRSTLENTVAQPDLTELLEKSRFLAIRVRLDSKPSDEAIRIFADYTIESSLVAEFSYRITP